MNVVGSDMESPPPEPQAPLLGGLLEVGAAEGLVGLGLGLGSGLGLGLGSALGLGLGLGLPALGGGGMR